MTVLEFIRKNSLLVLIVIVALFVGLVMMDYSGKGSAFSNNYYFKVNDTAYDNNEAQNLGGYGFSHLRYLREAAVRKYVEEFGDDTADWSADPEQALRKEIRRRELEGFVQQVTGAMEIWCSVGVTKRSEDNLAINRAIIREEAAKMGIKPSKDQIDAYIQKLPVFTDSEGNFDQELYQHLSGYRNGVANKASEKSFRSVVEDLMLWELLQKTLISDVISYTPAANGVTDLQFQRVSGRTAWLAAGSVSKPAAPTDEETKKYWEGHKSAYKTPERRVVTLYTIKPEGDSGNVNDLGVTAQEILDAYSTIKGAELEEVIKKAQANPEVAPFTYTVQTAACCTKDAVDELLKLEVEGDEGPTPVAEVAFSKGKSPLTVDAYEKAKAEGKLTHTKAQVPCWCLSKDKTAAVFVCIEAVDSPRELTYEEAHDAALKDFVTERENNALQIAADKMYADMNAAMAEGGLEAAFKKAEEAGATVDHYGPAAPGLGTLVAEFPQIISFPFVANGMQLNADLPKGMDLQAMAAAPSNKLLPLVVLPDEGARVTVVERRTVEDSEDMRAIKDSMLILRENELRVDIMKDFLITAAQRLKIQLSKYLTGSED